MKKANESSFLGNAARRFWRNLLLVLVLGCSIPALTGCGPIKNIFGSSDNKDAEDFFIPEQDTAEQQFAYAEYVRERIPPSTNDKRREEQMERVIEAYEKVEELFPNDREFTPIAKCKIGMLYMRTPNRKADGARVLHEVESQYPDMDAVQIRSLLHLGYYYDDGGQYERAQEYYREVFERWGDSTDAEEIQMANRARNRYNRVRPRTQQ